MLQGRLLNNFIEAQVKHHYEALESLKNPKDLSFYEFWTQVSIADAWQQKLEAEEDSDHLW